MFHYLSVVLIMGFPMNNAFALKLIKTGPSAPRDLEIYHRQTVAFERKFGRKMGPQDPFFFDPDAPAPRFRAPEDETEAIDVLAGLMAEMGIEPAAIYAFWRTGGFFPTPGPSLSEEETRKWNAAVDEYRAQMRAWRNRQARLQASAHSGHACAGR